MCKIKKFMAELTEMTTMTKKEYFLTATTCLLGGIVLGMLCSPRKYVKIGSENGSHNKTEKQVKKAKKAGKKKSK